MSEAAKSAFLVDPHSDPVLVRVEGRACFQNSAGLRDFISTMIAQGRRRFVLDFQHCASMDSTFLGVLAGAAFSLRKFGAGTSLVVARASPRNLELMRGLGLHRLLTIAPSDLVPARPGAATALAARPQGELECARLALEAHENLVSADDANRAKFEDVLSFLRARTEQK